MEKINEIMSIEEELIRVEEEIEKNVEVEVIYGDIIIAIYRD